MDFMSALDVAASGLGASRAQLNVISMNLANINTTRTVITSYSIHYTKLYEFTCLPR